MVKIDFVEIYTDGACKGNPGPGGWGALLRYNGREKTLCGGAAETTNNRMELQAVISALSALNKSCKIILTTDSQYVKNGIEKWMHDWKQRNWKTSAKKPVKNKDLWEALDKLVDFHEVKWKWVKGHSGHKENTIADQLANEGVKPYL